MKKSISVIAVILSIMMLIASCGKGSDNSKPTPAPASTPDPELVKNKITATIELEDYDDITLELYPDLAPETVENFVELAEDGFYDGTVFHRVIEDFMIQGGGMDAEMNEKATNAPVENEADNGLKNAKGTIAMARTQDPHSATRQFFINVKDNDFLNHSGKNMQGWGYTVFGKVTSGMDVIDKMRGVPTGRFGMHADVPNEPVVIKSATIVTQ